MTARTAKRMTIEEIKKALLDAGIENAHGEAHILKEEFFGENLKKAVERRIKREPLQYIIGRWPFFREEYFVSPDCLIPRSDTEVLVEWLVKNLPQSASLLDLCTGSGCIAISTAKNRPDISATGADISEAALEIAKKNAAHNHLDVCRFIRADVCKPSEFTETFDCISANPPYITTDAMKTLEKELSYEPEIALHGGKDGMDFYRAIVKNFSQNLKKGGFFAFEFGYDQREAALSLADENGFGFFEIYDYGGNFRAAIFRKED